MSLIVLGVAVLLNSLAVVAKPQAMEAHAHGSDIRKVTITLASGNFAFTSLKIYDAVYPFTERYIFGAGEGVRFNGSIRNNGQITANARIDMSDADTGEVIGYFLIYNIPAGGETMISPVDTVVVLGDMPNRNWNVNFTLTP